MIRINLLPVRAAQKKEALRAQVSVVILSIVAMLVACGAIYFTQSMKIAEQKDELARIDQEIQQLRKQIGEVRNYEKLKKELTAKLDVLDQLKAGQSGPVRLLDELSIVLPQRLWLTSFKESSGSVTINGVGINENAVARFMQNLESSPFYRGVELQVTEQVSQDGMKLQKFSVSAATDVTAGTSPP